jgi:hypothetical protein
MVWAAVGGADDSSANAAAMEAKLRAATVGGRRGARGVRRRSGAGERHSGYARRHGPVCGRLEGNGGRRRRGGGRRLFPARKLQSGSNWLGTSSWAPVELKARTAQSLNVKPRVSTSGRVLTMVSS